MENLNLYLRFLYCLSAIWYYYYVKFQALSNICLVPSTDSVGWRMLVRLSIMAALLFIGESIPRFYTILALVGGTTVALLTFVLPAYCYLKLIEQPAAAGQEAP